MSPADHDHKHGRKHGAFQPFEMDNPIPWPVLAVALALAIWGGVTLYTTEEADDSGPAAQQAASPAAGPPPEDKAASDVQTAGLSGATVFLEKCATCHQTNGVGVNRAVPPLAGSRYVAADPAVMVQIILHGIDGPITVRGQTYDGRMPTFGDVLSDAEIVAVVSHARTAWGNDFGTIEPGLVAEQRTRFPDRASPWQGGAELAEVLGVPAQQATAAAATPETGSETTEDQP